MILERTLSKLPNNKCWWVGEMKPGLSLDDALEFSRGYNSELSLGVNDCRHHTLGDLLFNLFSSIVAPFFLVTKLSQKANKKIMCGKI